MKMRLEKYSKRLVLIVSILISMVFLFAEFFANNKPIICSVNNEVLFPCFKEFGFFITGNSLKIIDDKYWENIETDWAIWPPIMYGPKSLDATDNSLVGPFDSQIIKHGKSRHILGTDEIGRDILSRIIYGGRISLFIGVGASLISLIIGLFFGGIAGFFGDFGLRLKIDGFLSLLFVFCLLFYFIWLGHYTEGLISSIGILISIVLIITIFIFSSKQAITKKNLITIPIDNIIMRLIDVMRSIPLIFVLMTLATIFRSSMFLIIIVISLFSWTGFALILRNDIIRIRELNYFKATKLLGFSNLKIFLFEILPNAFPPLFIAFTFAIPGAIIFEGNISFLGVGLDPDTPSWGNILAESKNNFSAWWITLFPGLCLFGVILFFQNASKILPKNNSTR